MAMEMANLSGLIQAGTPVMTRGSARSATKNAGMSSKLASPASVSSGLNAQARRRRSLAERVVRKEVVTVVIECCPFLFSYLLTS